MKKLPKQKAEKVPVQRKESCVWKEDTEGFESWNTSCGNEFIIESGTPKENEMNFCCYCGKVLKS